MTHPRNTIEEKSATDRDRLSPLPNDLLRHSIFPFLSHLAPLGWTNKRLGGVPECEKAKKAIIKDFFFFVSHGQKDQAEGLVSQCPDLLFLESEVKDYSGRKLQGTALGIALGAEDVNLYANDGTPLGEGMVEMLLHHLREQPHGEAEIARQILRQFPAGWEEKEEKEHERQVSALRKVWDAIKAASNNEECQAAILEFKNALAPQEIIATGKHWNAKLLQAAFEMGHYEPFQDDLCHKDDLFYNEVIGYLQTLAPANYAMAQAQGLKSLLEKGEKFKRNLLTSRNASHYYRGDACQRTRLGSWIDCYFGKSMKGLRRLRSLDSEKVWWCLIFKTLLKQKQQNCDNLCRSQTFTQTPALTVS